MKAIGKYQIIDEIGTGAAGTTYRVRDTAGERELALKVLYSSQSASPETKDQFCRNLASYTELRHPHIAKVQDLGEADGALYVATELLNGIDLRRHFEERRVLPLEEKLEFIAEIADALTVPHSRGIAHGNLKPGNIFIVAGKNAKILDFGSGKWLEVILATGVKPAALLPNYLAPEQILGEPFDTRSDIFSVALILYELLTGKYPFQVAPNLIPREIVHSDAEPLRKLDSQIPEELERLVARALNRNRGERLRSAAEFAAGLNSIAQKVRDSRTAPAPVPAVSAAPVTAPAVEAKPSPTMVVTVPKRPAAVPSAPPPAQPATPATVAAATVSAPPRLPVPAPPQPAAAKPALAAIKTAAQESRKKPVIVANAGLLRKRMIPIAIAAVLAIVVFGTLLSRQNSQASQHKTEAPAIQPNDVAPTAAAPTTPVSVPIQPADTAQPQPTPQIPEASPVVEVKPAPELILRGQVKSLWEAGKYAQAEKLVDVILNEHPSHAEARAWRKKIRAAQEAEAAIK
jgi:eukaryotic-like serine/threonine-protein kinase